MLSCVQDTGNAVYCWEWIRLSITTDRVNLHSGAMLTRLNHHMAAGQLFQDRLVRLA